MKISVISLPGQVRLSEGYIFEFENQLISSTRLGRLSDRCLFEFRKSAPPGLAASVRQLSVLQVFRNSFFSLTGQVRLFSYTRCVTLQVLVSCGWVTMGGKSGRLVHHFGLSNAVGKEYRNDSIALIGCRVPFVSTL